MPLFVCDRCGNVDNTTYGRYWTKDHKGMWSEDNVGKALCSECAPLKYRNGDPCTSFTGKWHGLFLKEKPSQEEIRRGEFINR